MAASKNCLYYNYGILSDKNKAKDNYLFRPNKILALLVLIIILLIAFAVISCKNQKYIYSNYQKLNRPDKVTKLKSFVINKFELFFPVAFSVINNYLGPCQDLFAIWPS
ncbi:MAG: hypothetical protein C0168_05545 [Candidatus Aminicenantes bacterium]|nr:MAG: hypothetical protein C0168_05545 [Candidatus Aminicenantes bacterium]